MVDIPHVSVHSLHERLSFSEPLSYPASSLSKPLTEWDMEEDDAPILRYLYRNLKPHRHLEFGTWQGMGALYCLEECDATVWTINLLEGEAQSDGNWTYCHVLGEQEKIPLWSREQSFYDKQGNKATYYQSDSLGFIGRKYREKKFSHRVCQIYCDSRKWDTNKYCKDYFDSALIDGGHQVGVVINDTFKALKLLRPGGMIVWHDFCPNQEVLDASQPSQNVYNAIALCWSQIGQNVKDLFWIEPSYILLGMISDSSKKTIFTGKLSEDPLWEGEMNKVNNQESKQPKVLINNTEKIFEFLQEDAAEKDKAITSLQDELRQKDKTIASMQDELRQKDATIDLLQNELRKKDATIDSLQNELREKDEAIDSLQQKLDSIKKSFIYRFLRFK